MSQSCPTSYRTVWRTGTIVLGGLCALVALLSFPLGPLLMVAGASAIVAGSVSLLSADERSRTQLKVDLTRSAAVGAWAVLAVIAAMGTLAVFGPGGLLLFLAFIASSPAALRRAGKHGLATGTREPATDQAPPRPVAGAVHQWSTQITPQAVAVPEVPAAMTDRELMFAWRLSCIHRGHIHTIADQLDLAQQRAILLDEMERLDPAGFAAWMSSGAFGNPAAVLNFRQGARPQDGRDRPSSGAPLNPEDGE